MRTLDRNTLIERPKNTAGFVWNNFVLTIIFFFN